MQESTTRELEKIQLSFHTHISGLRDSRKSVPDNHGSYHVNIRGVPSLRNTLDNRTSSYKKDTGPESFLLVLKLDE